MVYDTPFQNDYEKPSEDGDIFSGAQNEVDRLRRSQHPLISTPENSRAKDDPIAMASLDPSRQERPPIFQESGQQAALDVEQDAKEAASKFGGGLDQAHLEVLNQTIKMLKNGDFDSLATVPQYPDATDQNMRTSRALNSWLNSKNLQANFTTNSTVQNPQLAITSRQTNEGIAITMTPGQRGAVIDSARVSIARTGMFTITANAINKYTGLPAVDSQALDPRTTRVAQAKYSNFID